MHRAEQIVDALVALMPTTAVTFKHRVLTINAEEGELPARSVRMGQDQPIDEDGASNFAFIDSLLTIEIDHQLQASDEQTALTALMVMRSETHVAVMADRSLGLAFVIDTRYQGAEMPERDVVNEYVAGVLTSQWTVHYRMNILNPD